MSRTLVGAAVTVLLGTFAVVPASAEPAPPTIIWVGAIDDSSTYLFGQVPEAPTCTAVQDTVAVPCVVTGYVTTVGVHTLTATATPAVEPVVATTQTRSYTVQAWSLKGFYKPVKMGEGVWNTVKAGRTVPLTFTVYEGAVKAKTADVVAGFTAQQVVSSTDLTAIGAPVSLLGGAKGFRLKYNDGAFHKNWKTPKLAKAIKVAKVAKAAKGDKGAKRTLAKHTLAKHSLVGAYYVVTMMTKDGSSLTASFRLK